MCCVRITKKCVEIFASFCTYCYSYINAPFIDGKLCKDNSKIALWSLAEVLSWMLVCGIRIGILAGGWVDSLRSCSGVQFVVGSWGWMVPFGEPSTG